MSEHKQPRLLATEEEAFLRSILASPDDEAPRLIYADWLEERGDPRGEFLRVECALARLPDADVRRIPLEARFRELRPGLDADWLVALARSPVENCSLRFKFRCPLRWDRLKPTVDAAVRSCDACLQDVHYCDTIGEARTHARLGHCVAINAAVARRPGDLNPEPRPMLMGVIDLSLTRDTERFRDTLRRRRGRGE